MSTIPDIGVFPVYGAGAFYIIIDGEQAHIPFSEVTPHVSGLLELLDTVAVEQYEEARTDEHE